MSTPTDTRTKLQQLRTARDNVQRLTARDEAQAMAHDHWQSSAERRQLRRQLRYWQGEVNRLRREIEDEEAA